MTARLVNAGSEPVRVLTDEFFNLVSLRLTDARGREIPARDSRATHGMTMPPSLAKSVVLAPGQNVELEVFDLISASAWALAGSLSWELQNHPAETLRVHFHYAVSAETAKEAERLGVAQVAVGEWKSKPVSFKTPSWPMQTVAKALSAHRTVENVSLLPLVVKVLEKSPDTVEREWAAVSLGQAKYLPAVNALSSSLAGDKAREVRISCAEALGDIGSSAAAAALAKAAKEDSDDLVRTRAERALARCAKR